MSTQGSEHSHRVQTLTRWPGRSAENPEVDHWQDGPQAIELEIVAGDVVQNRGEYTGRKEMDATALNGSVTESSECASPSAYTSRFESRSGYWAPTTTSVTL